MPRKPVRREDRSVQGLRTHREIAMNKTLPTLLISAAAALVTVVAPVPVAAADSTDDVLELDQGARPDVTPADRYKVAVDHANVALRLNLARCEKMQSADRAECTDEAHNLFDAAMASASDGLANPR